MGLILEGSEQVSERRHKTKVRVLTGEEEWTRLADLESVSHEAARLQTPPPAQLTPGWQQVRQEAEAGHTTGMCSCSLPRWFFLKKKAGLSSFLSKTHVANSLVGTKLGTLTRG